MWDVYIRRLRGIVIRIVWHIIQIILSQIVTSPSIFLTCNQSLEKLKENSIWGQYEVKKETKLAEKEHVPDQILKNKNNTNSLWKAIQSCLPKKSASQMIYSKDNTKVVDEFNRFFSSAGSNTVRKVGEPAERLVYKLEVHPFIPRVSVMGSICVSSSWVHAGWNDRNIHGNKQGSWRY